MMTHHTGTLTSNHVPRPIVDKLTQVMDSHRDGERLFRYGGWLTFSIVSLLIMVSVDLAIEIDSIGMRLGGWLLAISSVLLLGYRWQRLVERPLSYLEAAWRVEKIHPQMDERLSSTIELIGVASSGDEKHASKCSPQLLAALTKETEAVTSHVDPQSIPRRSHWPITAGVATTGTLLLAFMIINPAGVFCSLRNWVMPWATPIFPELSTALLPGDATIVEGEAFVITAPSLDSDLHAEIEYESKSNAGTIPLNQFSPHAATLEGLSEDTTYRLRIGKRVGRDYRLSVLSKPKILGISVQVDFPEYTGLPAETYVDPAEPIHALSGSKVTIQASADEHAKTANLVWRDSGERLTASDQFHFEIQCAQPITREASIYANSPKGIASESETFKLAIHADQPPTIEILDPSLPRFYLPRDRELSVQFAAQDDMDVRQVELLYKATDSPVDQQPISIVAPIERLPDQDKVAYQGQVFVKFDALPEATQAARVWLRVADNRDDTHGGPQTTESDSILIEFRQIDATPVEQRLEAEQQAIQEALAEAKQALNDAQSQAEKLAKELAQGSEQEPVKQANDTALESTRSQTEAGKQALQRLAEKVEQSNSDLAEQSKAAQEITDEPLADAAQHLEKASWAETIGDKRREVEQAEDQITKTIDKLEQLEQSLNDKMSELKAAAKLEDLARQQQTLSDEVSSDEKGANAEMGASKDTAAEPQPTEEWKQRQSRVANEIAAMQQPGEPSEKDQAKADQAKQASEPMADQQALEQQAASAERLANQAQKLAERLDQPEADKPQEARQAEALQQITEMQEEAERLASQVQLEEEAKKPLQDAQEQLAQARQQIQEPNAAPEDDSRDPEAAKPADHPQQQPDNQTQVNKSGQADTQQATDTQKQAAMQKQAANPDSSDKQEQARAEKQADKQGQPDKQRQAENQERSTKTPSASLREASEKLQQVCNSCRECANGQKPGKSGQKAAGVSADKANEPMSAERTDKSKDEDGKQSEAKTDGAEPTDEGDNQTLAPEKLAAAQRECEAASSAPSQEQAQQHAQQAADQLAELADQAAIQSGLRKNCEKCRNPGAGQATSDGKSGTEPGKNPKNTADGTKSVTDQPFERLPLRGGASSTWTRAKRQLRNGVLDGRESMVPESFRDVVTGYFEALAQETEDAVVDDFEPDASDKKVRP